MGKFHVILDNGHGKDTPGKRSPKWRDGQQLLEYDYTRKVVRDVYDLLNKSYKIEGIEAHILTPELEDVLLSERARRANELVKYFGKDNCLGISVHVNAFNGEATGWEVHTYLGESLSDKYAAIFWKTFDRVIGEEILMRKESNDNLDKDSNFAILRETLCPFILTENGFMDSEAECKWLLSEEGFKHVVDCHVFSILRSFRYWKECKDKENFSGGGVDSSSYYFIEV